MPFFEGALQSRSTRCVGRNQPRIDPDQGQPPPNDGPVLPIGDGSTSKSPVAPQVAPYKHELHPADAQAYMPAIPQSRSNRC